MVFVDSPEVHHKSKVWHHNDTIYCHDPIKQAVQRVQTGCQYGGIHHLRCSSVFVQTPQNHQVISSQTDSAQKHTSSWKNFGFNIFSIIWIFLRISTNQTPTKRPPSWWGTLVTFTALSTKLMLVGVLPSVELERVKTARYVDLSYGSRTPVGENPPLYPPNLNKHTRQKWEKTHTNKKGGSESWGGSCSFVDCPFFLAKKISVGGIPNSKEVCICKVYKLITTFSLLKHCGKVPKYICKVQQVYFQRPKVHFESRKVYVQSTKVYFQSTKSCFQFTKAYFQSTKAYFQSTKVYCQSTKTYFQSILSMYKSALSNCKKVLSTNKSILSKYKMILPKHKSILST